MRFDIPDNYEVLDKYVDWIRFDLTEEYTLKFEEGDFELLLQAIKQHNDNADFHQRFKWMQTDIGYEFKRCLYGSYPNEENCVDAEINQVEKTLYYKLMDI